MALTLGIRYLTGYTVATDPASRRRAEWPPHPARVFMAMAAAHFETEVPDDGGQARRQWELEAAALRWLEKQGEPHLYAAEADERNVLDVFVPVNDQPTGSGMLQSVAGLMRDKQPRTFPRVRPHDETVCLLWPTADADADGHRPALEQVCAKVTRIGHSSSLVQMWVSSETPAADEHQVRWDPDDLEADMKLRVFSPGSLSYLDEQFGARARVEYQQRATQMAQLRKQLKGIKGKGSRERKAEVQEQITELEASLPDEPPRGPLRPAMSLWKGYRRHRPESGPTVHGSVWEPYLTVRRLEPEPGKNGHRRLDLVATLQITTAMHKAVLKMAHEQMCGCDRWDGDVPAWSDARNCYARIPQYISGHREDGAPTEQPHLAYLPLAFVGGEHASGHILGLAIAIPANLDRMQRRWALAAAGAVEQLHLGRLGLWKVLPGDEGRRNLQPEAWTAGPKGHKEWATVTPIAFDRHTKAKDRDEREREMAEMIARGCDRIGLPKPSHVLIRPVSAHLGVPASHQFPRLGRKDGGDRRHAHAILIFDQPVRGPIALGAGRYRGYGFCRPLSNAEVL